MDHFEINEAFRALGGSHRPRCTCDTCVAYAKSIADQAAEQKEARRLIEARLAQNTAARPDDR